MPTNPAASSLSASHHEERSPDADKLVRLPAVTARVGVRRTAVYELIKEGKFPRPVKVGTASAWVDQEITEWIENRKKEREAVGKRST